MFGRLFAKKFKSFQGVTLRRLLEFWVSEPIFSGEPPNSTAFFLSIRFRDCIVFRCGEVNEFSMSVFRIRYVGIEPSGWDKFSITLVMKLKKLLTSIEFHLQPHFFFHLSMSGFLRCFIKFDVATGGKPYMMLVMQTK